MIDWTSGYVADIGYTFGYFHELNPLRANLAFLNAGLVPPERGVHCELGFGQGMSVNIHAAASASTWHATDFNPAQAGFAQALVQASGANAHLIDQSFADFCTRSDLPAFDSIGLHGIWSWISDENRRVIVHFIGKKLKAGGVVYISYNTQPGWATFAPMRHLMTEHAAVMGSEGVGTVKRVDDALKFAERLLATNPIYARGNPQVAERLKKVRAEDLQYVAHEYFNRDWEPMHFAAMARWLAPAKMNYACSANYLEHIDGLNLRAEQQTFIQEIPDAMLRQTVRDFMVNQQFRKDYWVKGARKLNAVERIEALRAQKIILMTHRADVSLKVTGALGDATMQEAVHGPILDVLADHKTKTLAQLEQVLKEKGVSLAQLLQTVMIFAGAGHVATVQDEALLREAKSHADKLNAYLIDKARSSDDIGFLASPVTGGGVAVNRFQQLFLLAISQGKTQPAEWAQLVWALLAAQGQKIVTIDKTLETAEENLSEITAQARAFADKRLPVLKALQIA